MYFLVVVIQTLMSVQLSWTTVMKMPLATTPLVAFIVPAMLVLREMESTVQVRDLVMAVMGNLQHKLIMVYTYILCCG